MNTNVTVLEGRLTRDPEIKHVGEKETALTNFGIAVNKSRKVGDGWEEIPGFYEVQAWAYLADNAMQLSKGDAVIIVGALDWSSWDQEGQKRSQVRVTASAIGRQLMKNENNSKGKDEDDEIPF